MKKFEIPFIKFPQDWEIKFIAPVRGLRFLVKKDGAPNTVSVFVDYKDPSWQVAVYGGDYKDGTIGGILSENGEFHFELSDIDSLLKSIEEFLTCEVFQIPDFEEEN